MNKATQTREGFFLVFIEGFLSVFSLCPNPLKGLNEQIKRRRDIDAIAGDWQQVGNDIRNAYGKFQQEAAGASSVR